MGRKKSEKANAATLHPYSRTLNKARMAAIMGGVGLAVVAVAKFFLPPEFMKTALMMFVVGIGSALLSVGGTYRGGCPHCGADTLHMHAFGLRRFGCRKCSKPIVMERTADGVTFRRG